MIGRSGERRSVISVLAARHDDDDDSLVDFSFEADYRVNKKESKNIDKYFDLTRELNKL